MSYPYDLFGIRLVIIERIATSFISSFQKSFIHSDGKRWQNTCLITAYIALHKNLPKSFFFLFFFFFFFEKFEIISPFLNRRVRIFLLLKKRFNIFQHVSGAASGLLRFSLNSVINLRLAANMILVHSLDLVSAFSKSFFYYSYNIIIPIISFYIYGRALLICYSKFLSSTMVLYK